MTLARIHAHARARARRWPPLWPPAGSLQHCDGLSETMAALEHITGR